MATPDAGFFSKLGRFLNPTSSFLEGSLTMAKGGVSASRSAFRAMGLSGKTSAGARKEIAYGARFVAGAIAGAGTGAAWGAVSDRESIFGGAIKGAIVGGTFRSGMRGLNRNFAGVARSGRGFSRFANRNVKGNLKTARDFMNRPAMASLRNAAVGVGLLQGTIGMLNGTDNPVGGFVGGAGAGMLQGAAGMAGINYLRGMKWK